MTYACHPGHHDGGLYNHDHGLYPFYRRLFATHAYEHCLKNRADFLLVRVCLNEQICRLLTYLWSEI